MRYIITHGAKADDGKIVYMNTYAAEIAETAEQAAALFLEKHPDRRVISIHEATERDKIYGLGYFTDDERQQREKKMQEMRKRDREEMEEIRARVSEYSPEEFAANIEHEERRKTEETQNAEGVHLGDIFYSSWGYDQTNIDFYQVVQLKGKHTLVLRRIKEKCGEARTYNGLTRPIRDEFEPVERYEPQTVRTKFVDYYGNGKKELHVCVKDHPLKLTEFGKLYDYSTGA